MPTTTTTGQDPRPRAQFHTPTVISLQLALAALLALGCNGHSTTPEASTSSAEASSGGVKEGALEATDVAMEATDAAGGEQETAKGTNDEAIERSADGSESGADSVVAADEEWREHFWSSPQDPPTEFLDAVSPELTGRHYLASDEWNVHLFIQDIENLGGAYVGVGTDQAYLFIGWQKPEYAWLVDYDPWVVALHRAYGVFFDKAETPEEFRAFLSTKSLDGTEALLREQFAGDKDAHLIRLAFRKARRRAASRLQKLQEQLDGLGIKGFINDQDTYDAVRTRVRAGKVRPMLANLLETKGLRGIGAAAKALDVPIRVLYLSNAEEYWKYTDNYRQNIAGLPFDERSVVLRAISSQPKNNDYHYFVQGALNYLTWLAEPRIDSVFYVARRRRIKSMDDIPFRRITEGPESGLERKRKHADRDLPPDDQDQ